jgi:hypothetical protein
MKPVVLFTIAGLFLAAVLLAGCTGNIPLIHPPVAYPQLSPVPGQGELETPGYGFRFEDGEYHLTFPVDRGIYEAARAQDKSARIYDASVGEEDWTRGLYRAMILDPAEDPVYDRVLSEFREIRDEEHLDQDEYLELITAFVQQLPYQTVHDTDPKYPVETLVEGSGDCDDKSILLAGLLDREGYQVALLYFAGEKHMAVGVGATEGTFRNTGLAYVETTNLSLVGIPTSELEGGATLNSDPLVIPVKKDGALYSRCNETGFIWAEMNKVGDDIATIGPVLDQTYGEMEDLSERIEAENDEMQTLKREGRVSAYNSGVTEYNRHVAEYNALLDRYQATAKDYNRAVELHNTIMSRLYDRKGLYLELWGRGDRPTRSIPGGA